jgi:uncharacterized membrane protein
VSPGANSNIMVQFMTLLILGLIVFLGVHTFTTFRGPRAALVARIGEGPYKGLYSLVALAGFVLIVIGFRAYREAGYIDVWNPPAGFRHVTLLLMWFAMVSLVATYAPGAIKSRLKHPMLVALKIWALAHLLANGDLGSIILFGALLAWAVFDRIAVKRRVDAPVLVRQGFGRGDIVALVLGTLLYLAMLKLHPVLIGVPVIN